MPHLKRVHLGNHTLPLNNKFADKSYSNCTFGAQSSTLVFITTIEINHERKS